jgi:hypothetical protein
VHGTRNRATGQTIAPPFPSETLVEVAGGQAALLFDAAARHGPLNRTVITGSAGPLASHGSDLDQQQVRLATAAGVARPVLQGTWFNDAFAGAMGALLRAVETGGRPLNDACSNLDGLALAFAAIAAAHRGGPVTPGEIRSLREAQS